MSRNLPISSRISVDVQQLFEDLIVVKCNVNNKEFQGILLNTSKSFFGINESRLKGGAENWAVSDAEKANISFSCSAERYSYKIDGSGPTLLTRHPVKRHKSPPLSGKHVICQKCQSVVTIPADPSAEPVRRPSTSETDSNLSELASRCAPNRRKSSMPPRRLANFDTHDNFDSSLFNDIQSVPPVVAPEPAVSLPKLVKKKKKKEKDRAKERPEAISKTSDELRHKLKKRKLESNIERIPLKKSKLFDSEAEALQAQAIHAMIPSKPGRSARPRQEDDRGSEDGARSSKRADEEAKANTSFGEMLKSSKRTEEAAEKVPKVEEKTKSLKGSEEEKKASEKKSSEFRTKSSTRVDEEAKIEDKPKSSKLSVDEKKPSKSSEEKVKKRADEEPKASKLSEEKTKSSKASVDEKKPSKSSEEKAKSSKRSEDNKKTPKASDEKASRTKSSKRTEEKKAPKRPDEDRRASKSGEEKAKISKRSDEDKKAAKLPKDPAVCSKQVGEESVMSHASSDGEKVLPVVGAAEEKERCPPPSESSSKPRLLSAESSVRSEDDRSVATGEEEEEGAASSSFLDKGLKKLKKRLDAEKKVKRRQRALQKELAELGQPPVQINGERPRRSKQLRLGEEEEGEDEEEEEEEEKMEVSSAENPPDSSLSLKIKINRTASSDNGGYECRILADDGHAAVSSSCDPPPAPKPEEEVKVLTRCALPSGVSFAVNDVVWAKITGYPWWPARITAIRHAKAAAYTAEVLWFNWDQISFIPCDKLFPFLEHYAAKYDKKRKGAYRSAVEQAWMAAQAAQSFADDDDDEEEVRFDSYGQCLSRPSSSGLLASPVSSSSAPPPEQHEGIVSSSRAAAHHESSDEEAESGLVIDTDTPTPRVP